MVLQEYTDPDQSKGIRLSLGVRWVAVWDAAATVVE
jgi:hypothetical protein